MPVSILSTKLYIPPPSPKAVLRPHLLERLNGGLHRKLTIIAAPAGCGKTTLLSTWVASCNRPTAWLSLDAGDSDQTRFLTYLVAALETAMPHIGEGAMDLLQSPGSHQPAAHEAVLTALLNEIAAVPSNSLLVLDDYHLIDSEAVDAALTFLIEHLPPQLHLVIASREDPPLPLARLRARDQLTELRAGDLRFSPTEAAGFLNDAMNLNLSAEDVAALETRTEGWIAGLQLAALSLQGHPDISRFIRTFAGDHRYIADYLVEEVLQRQPEAVRTFLLRTSILERLHGPLCDIVTGQQGGQARLASLERGNFLVVPLDDNRQWYRYHHLFADVLYIHLLAEQPGEVASLHQRASEWHEQHGSIPDAIHHALAAEDFERAAGLVEMAAPAMRRSRQEATLLHWFKALPEALFRRRPVLSVEYAGALLSGGELDGVENRLQDAERWIGPSGTTADVRERPEDPATAMVVVDEKAFRRLPGVITVYRAAQNLALGDVPGTMTYAARALDLLPEDDHLWRGAATTLLGLSYWARGDLEAAYRLYSDGMTGIHRAGNISDKVGGAIALADIRITQGRLREAMRIYENALQLAADQGEPALRGTADMYVGMSELLREHGDLQGATRHLLRSKAQGEHTGFPQYPYRWRVAMSRIQQARGDLNGALGLLNEAERLYVSDYSPNVRPIAALRARVWLAQGRLEEALGWAGERGLSIHDEPSYLREFEHITLARVLLARHRSGEAEHSVRQAMELLERLMQAAEAGERMGSAIEILVLQALAHQAQGEIRAGLVPLARALALAEPEGYVRIFIDEGPPMAALLEEAAKHGEHGEHGKLETARGYVLRLLAAFGDTGKAEESQEKMPVKQVLVEPLSVRELEVLRLLRSDLSGPEIARELTVSLHTMRTHTNNIYIKLGVNNRRAAVRRAEELNML